MRALALASALALAAALALAGQGGPEELSLTIRCDQKAGVASPLLAGCSLPAPGAPGAAALLPNLLRNASFEMSPAAKPLPLPKEWVTSPGWEFRSCGSKRVLARTSLAAGDPLLFVAGKKWDDYHVTLFARKMDGPGGLAILFEAKDPTDCVRWTLGAFGNRFHILERVTPTATNQIGPPVVGHIEPGHCYRIDIVYRDRVLRCSLDGRLIHRLGGTGAAAAGVGLCGAGATAEYFDIAVADSRQTPLFLINHPAEATAATVAAGWEPLTEPRNEVLFGWMFLYPFNSNLSERIEVRKYAGGDAGIRQRGIPVAAGAACQGSVYLRANLTANATVSLRARDGKPLAQQTLLDVPNTWKRYDFELKPAASDPAADFCITTTTPAMLWIDMVSLAQADAVGPHGLRRDVVEALRGLRPPLLRWPAGPAANRDDWTRGIGPADERPCTAVADLATKAFELAPNSFGTDEFLGLCKDLGAEPVLVVNPRFGAAAALDWLEYCNGAATTRMGKLRAANGRPEPYGVKWWMIGDEPWDQMKLEFYGESAVKIAEALRKQDPAVRVIACGGPGPGLSDWDRQVAREAGPHLACLAASLRPAAAKAPDLDAFLALVRDSKLSPAFTNWLPPSDAAAPSLAVAAALSRLEAEAGPAAIATCPLLQAPGKGHGGLIAIGQDGLKTLAGYEVLKLFREHPLGEIVKVTVEPQGPSPIAAVAGLSGDSLVLRVQHAGDRPLSVAVALEGLGDRRPADKADLYRIVGAAPEHETLAVAGDKLALPLRPRAAHVIVLRLEGKPR